MVYNKPDERASLTVKLTEDWYKPNMHYWFAIASGVNDKEATQSNIDAANGIVSDKIYSHILDPLSTGTDAQTLVNLPDVLRSMDFITPIREKNIGEYIQLPNDFTVKVNDANFTSLKNTEVANKVRPFIEQAIINEINKNQDSGVDSIDNIDVEKIKNDTTEKWIDKRAERVHNLIIDINNENDLQNKLLTWFNSWWSTEELYIHVYANNGRIFYEDISPLEGYPISNGYEFTEDNEAFLINRKIGIDRIKEAYSEQLTKADIEYLDTLLDGTSLDIYNVNVEVYQGLYGRKAIDESGTGRTKTDTLTFSNTRNVDEKILYFKTDVKRSILHYINPLGQLQQKIVDNDFEINVTEGHILIEKKWISETWKQVLLGEEEAGIYLKPEILEIQLYDENGHNKLPIIGKKGLINGVYINPIPKRISPNLALSEVITHKIEQEIGKYKGTVEIIPKSLLKSDTNQSARGNMIYKKLDGTIIYDDTKVDPNTVTQGYRMVGDNSANDYIRTLIDYRTLIKDEAWDMANMNDSRFGKAPASSTVTNNQQNIFNAKLGSVLMINIFNAILIKLYTYALEFGKHLYPDGRAGSVFNNDGKITYYNINSGELTANKYGLYMSNAVMDFDKIKEYKDFAFAAAQNQEFGLAFEAIDGKNVSSIRQHLKDFIEETKEYNRRVKEEELAQQERINQANIKEKQDERAAKTNDIITKETMITERAITLKEMEVSDNSNNDNK